MIKIQHIDLQIISKEYSDKIKKAFLDKIINFEEIFKILYISSKIKKSEVSGKIKKYTKVLKAIEGINKLHNSKSPKGKGKDTDDLIYTLNRLKINSDKRSKCRKEKKYKKIENQIKILKYFINNNNLFESKPDLLLILNDKLNIKLNDFNKTVYNYFFNYEDYYEILCDGIGGKLDLKICPYCNRNFITYVSAENKRIIGPTYDHFFSKNRYKYLTLSFFNLIPSCYICNSNLKGNIDFKLDTHIHPYLGGFGDDVIFDFDLSTKDYRGLKKISFKPKLIERKTISIKTKERVFGKQLEKDSGSLNVFKLQEIYETHDDSVEEIHEKFDKNSKYYIGSISKIINKLQTSEEEFYRFHFRNYYNNIDFNKRPLAKLDRDIYDKMKDISESYNL